MPVSIHSVAVNVAVVIVSIVVIPLVVVLVVLPAHVTLPAVASHRLVHRLVESIMLLFVVEVSCIVDLGLRHIWVVLPLPPVVLFVHHVVLMTALVAVLHVVTVLLVVVGLIATEVVLVRLARRDRAS